jgi:hypothetical protein
MTMNDRRARRLILAGLAAVAAAGALALGWSTERGIGLQPDSAFYLDCAAHIGWGDGYVTGLQDYLRPITFREYAADIRAEGRVRPRPEVIFPPFYSLALAAGRGLGLDPERSARALGMLLFAVNIFLAGFIVYKYTAPSPVFAFAAAVVMLGSESTLGLHAYALSEPLFLALTLLGLIAVTAFLEGGGLWALAGGSLAAGLAFLTRYAGGALVAAGVIAILVFRRTNFPKRLAAAGGLALAGGIPVLAFIIRNIVVAGAATNRTPTVIPVSLGGVVLDLKTTLSSWIFPNLYRVLASPVAQDFLALAAVAALTGLVAAAVLVARRARKRGAPGAEAGSARPVLFALYPPVYAGYILFSMFFIDPEVPLDYRILAPIFVAGAVAGLIEMARIARLAWRGPLRSGLALAFGLYLAAYLALGGAWFVRLRSQGGGYNNREWRGPEMDAAAAAMALQPPGLPIVTNDDIAAHFLFGRDAYHIPLGQWPDRIEELKSAIGAGEALAILFKTKSHLARGEAPPDSIERLLAERLSVEPLVRLPSVSVFRIGGAR